MATLAALLKQTGHDVQGSDENVYPPMSTFLASEKIRTLSGYSAEHITSRIGLVVVGNAISRGNVELEAVLERKMRYCSLPEAVREHFLWTLALDCHCRHAREDDHHLVGRMAARAWRPRPEHPRWRHRAQPGRRWLELPVGKGQGLRHRRGRVRQRVLRQDREVPEVSAGHRRHQQRRIRSRRHLRRYRCGSACVPPSGQPGAALRSASAGGGLAGCVGTQESGCEPGRDLRFVRVS